MAGCVAREPDPAASGAPLGLAWGLVVHGDWLAGWRGWVEEDVLPSLSIPSVCLRAEVGWLVVQRQGSGLHKDEEVAVR